jgi:hypothetical protein
MLSHSSFTASSEGFTAIPRPVLDLLLCLPLSKRDLSILLLVVRLTYGCRNRLWAQIKQADLAAIGIGPTHAKDCLRTLLDRKLLLQHGHSNYYCINDALFTQPLPNEVVVRLDRLAVAVGRNLGKTSPFGKPVPRKVTLPLPIGEVFPYHNGNVSRASGWSFLRSRRKFEKDFDTSDIQ